MSMTIAEIEVTEANYTVAETDSYMNGIVKEHGVNNFRHARKMSSKDFQFVIRENQDVMYSHAVVDCAEGAQLTVADWDLYQIIQVIDENQYTIKVVYPGESFEITPDMLSKGSHVFLNCRTAARNLDARGYAEAHKQQDSLKIEAKSSKLYEPKGFDRDTLLKTRKSLVRCLPELIDQRYFFGTKEEMNANDDAKRQFLVASACGWGGLPVKDATYVGTIQATGSGLEDAPSRLHVPRPPLDYDRGGFFSVTTYNGDGWIATDNFALNDRQAENNPDGSVTFHFNADGEKNNITVEPNWVMVLRLYVPESVDSILEYIADIQNTTMIENL